VPSLRRQASWASFAVVRDFARRNNYQARFFAVFVAASRRPPIQKPRVMSESYWHIALFTVVSTIVLAECPTCPARLLSGEKPPLPVLHFISAEGRFPAYGLRPMAAVPPSETLARFFFSPPAGRLLAAASLQKRRELGCAAALRPKGSATVWPP